MSSDLYIDGDMLERVRTNLRNIAEILEDPGEAVDDLAGDDSGGSRLSERLNEFNDEWAYGIGQIAEFAGGAAETLQGIEQAFADYEHSLAESLQQARADG